ncbi:MULTISPECIES: retron St85 family RNA-directed DNA polymerase [Halorhodospira]|uniref:retron St85 family RNA-directed DNA polymerase n=1 Tax=Halorhodospira TaxID=85108 RepID=UPI001EE952F5|nr:MULTISPECIES: retron St85 family RNA-directed DNA polymerase [Halorhodospira]MCG5527740.1 retron St85 family RNA-directed DNA polymerase [Halorhodospira halophila]MCG5542390.1 retron St85 family RNA-directed DNA polymerase [Halorhodospira sp. 9628]
MSEESVRNQIHEGRRQIKIKKIPKKDGNFRKITIPPRIFKLVQYWTIKNILHSLPVHEAATAFKPGSSIRENAFRHRDGQYFVKMDVTNFFPSIKSDDFFSVLSRMQHAEADPLLDSKDDEDFLDAMFRNRACEIGYPASPHIANIVMFEKDTRIDNALRDRKQEFGNSTYTRYADDITVSIDQKGYKDEITRLVSGVVEDDSEPTLKINPNKTRFGTRRGGGAFVTGLRVLPEGRLTLHKSYKDDVRFLLKLYEQDRLERWQISALQGHLNYCSFADPDFYTRLMIKHLDSIEEIKGEGLRSTDGTTEN